MKFSHRFVLALLLCAALTGCIKQESTLNHLVLHFHPYVGDKPLVLNDATYSNPGGEGQFRIRDFQFYLSNLRFNTDISEHNVDMYEHKVEDSYHLLRFDNDSGTATVALEFEAVDIYSYVTFGVGVDAGANGSIRSVGDLDPNSRMAWSWDVGYKFILLEGTLENESGRQPLVYHVGFDENYREVTLPLKVEVVEQTGVAHFKVDLLALFSRPSPLDLASLPSVKFDPDDAARIASGFTQLLAPCPQGCER